MMEMSYTYDRNGGIVTFQFILRVDKKIFGLSELEIPDSLQGALKSVE
jgi:hypothetical protein